MCLPFSELAFRYNPHPCARARARAYIILPPYRIMKAEKEGREPELDAMPESTPDPSLVPCPNCGGSNIVVLDNCAALILCVCVSELYAHM